MISVIIPYYNASVTIKKCIDSVLSQGYKDFEVIIVNDGSVFDYRINDCRIKLINIPHGGVSRARNIGIEHSKGDYIFFLDADDVLTKDALSTISGIHADLVISGYASQIKTVRWYVSEYLKAPNRNTQLAFAWGKLFKTSIIKENGICFLSMDKHEDTQFVFNYLTYAKTVCFVQGRTVLHVQPETGKGMEEFDASGDREKLLDTIRGIINDDKLINNCRKILCNVDLVRSCRNYKKTLRHPLLTLKATKRYTPIIIFGAGAVGMLLAKECRRRNIRIEAFCDERNISEFGGMRVLSIEETRVLFPSARFLVATADVKAVIEKIHFGKLLYKKTVKLLKNVRAEGYDALCLANCIDANNNHSNKHFMKSLDLMITERCTLKCRDCSNLMQYYKNPKDISAVSVLNDLKGVMEKYTIGEIRVIGGEPFLHHEYEKIIQALENNKKIKRIVIYTNGTVVPTRLVGSKKVFVLITEYKDFSLKIPLVEEHLRSSGVPYQVQKPEWTDCGKIEKHNRTHKENNKIYMDCCSKNLTLSEGKVYPCAFSANLARLGKKIYLGCDYCNGRPFNAQTITPAIQKEAQ